MAAAEAAVAAAGGTAELSERAGAPALVEARPQALLLAVLRLGLAAIGVAAAIVRGLDPGVAAALFAFGLALLLVSVISGGRAQGLGPRLAGAETPPDERRVEHRLRALALATYPSTIGLTVLIAISLVVRPALAAVLCGILAGLGGVAFALAAQLVAHERGRGMRILVEPRPQGRVFEVPR
ncbi:MAG: hypothetical protein QOG06_2525 [Gaiellaceae bacterium]|nr:hypothetical protein [Gaiellaceae bacterium]